MEQRSFDLAQKTGARLIAQQLAHLIQSNENYSNEPQSALRVIVLKMVFNSNYSIVEKL